MTIGDHIATLTKTLDYHKLEQMCYNIARKTLKKELRLVDMYAVMDHTIAHEVREA